MPRKFIRPAGSPYIRRFLWALLAFSAARPDPCSARRYLDKDFESRACDSDATVDWTGEVEPDKHPFVRYDIPTPQGARYTEFWTKPNSLGENKVWQPNRPYNVGDMVSVGTPS